MFGSAKPAAAGLEGRALAAAMLTEVGGDMRIGEEAGGGKVRVGGAELVDERPERSGVGWSFRPAGEEGAQVAKRERGAEIEADERVDRHLAEEPGQHLGAAPAMAGADDGGGGTVLPAERDGDAGVPLADRAGPVDRREMAEAAQGRSPDTRRRVASARFLRPFMTENAARLRRTRRAGRPAAVTAPPSPRRRQSGRCRSGLGRLRRGGR